MGKGKPLAHHFVRVAPRYAHVRNTDPDIIETIIRHVPRHTRSVDLADVGCGTGRYTHFIARSLDGHYRLFCCDYCIGMLAECRKRMRGESLFENIHYCRISAEDLPFADGSFDGVVTFNAVHHFDLDRFVVGASRVLRPGGLLSIYTRTPEQNARTIWGQHFPCFTERETRLYRCERLEEAISDASGLQMEGIQEFTRVRVESGESLLNRVRNFHYSTFALYPKGEFIQAVETFAQRLRELTHRGLIEHTAENTLVLARRE